MQAKWQRARQWKVLTHGSMAGGQTTGKRITTTQINKEDGRLPKKKLTIVMRTAEKSCYEAMSLSYCHQTIQ